MPPKKKKGPKKPPAAMAADKAKKEAAEAQAAIEKKEAKAKAKAKAKGKEKSKSKASKDKAKKKAEEDECDFPVDDVKYTLAAPSSGATASTAKKLADFPLKEVNVVPFGRGYTLHKRLALLGDTGKKKAKVEKEDSDAFWRREMRSKSKVQQPKKRAGKKGPEQDEDDYYRTLGLSKIGWRATQDDITAAYKRACMKWHPDRNLSLNGDESAIHRVNYAYTILMNDEKRRSFDSHYDCDDRLPPATLEGDFFETYGPVFERNARWSVKQPTPAFGGADTPYEEVVAFYDFWMEFESWRIFEQNDEHDDTAIANADREMGRQMKRENERDRKKQKKEENSRIRTLTEQAEKVDPRIKAKKQAEQDAKDAEEAQKAAAAAKEAEAEAKKKAEEDAKAAAAAAEEAKKYNAGKNEHKAKKAALKEARRRLRKAGAEHFASDPLKVEALCSVLDTDALNALCDRFTDADAARAAFDEVCAANNVK